MIITQGKKASVLEVVEASKTFHLEGIAESMKKTDCEGPLSIKAFFDENRSVLPDGPMSDKILVLKVGFDNVIVVAIVVSDLTNF